jgi:hypothetical protein
LTEPLRQIAESTAPETAPLRDTAKTLLDEIGTFGTEPHTAASLSLERLKRIERAADDWDTLRRTWTVRESSAADDEENNIPSLYVPSQTALGEIAAVLQRRVEIWHLAIQAENAETFPITKLYGKTADDAERLFGKTGKVVRYIYSGKSNSGKDRRSLAETWCQYFDLEAFVADLTSVRNSVQNTAGKPPIQRISLAEPSDNVSSESILSEEGIFSICRRANTLVARLNSPKLSEEQHIFLSHPDIAAWKDELQNWTADTVTPQSVLQSLERYEASGGMTDMKTLSQLAGQLAASKTPAYRRLGSAIERQYGMPNLKVYISRSLINRHIPPVEQEVARFREVIQDIPVVGRQQTDTDVEMLFVKDPSRLLFVLGAGIDLETQSRSDAFAAQLFNTGSTSVTAYKGIELTHDGLVFYPCEARITDYRLQLVNLRTNFDDVPLLSRLFRSVVRDQYNSKAGAARSETQRKILRQVRSRLDKETEERFGQFNEKYKAFSQYIGEQFDLHVTKQDARTDDDWLLTSWAVRSADTLGSGALPPETPDGVFADVKLHESLVNLFLGQLGLEGNAGKVRDFKKTFAEKFQYSALAEEAEGDDVEIMFAPYNPLTVRFIDGRIELTIKIASMRLLKQTHRNFKVIVRYKPAADADGKMVLERDGYISLINVRAQIVMRAVFGKIFPASRTQPLTPKFLENAPQFDYLTVRHCRIQNGWFAAALTERQE